MRADSWLLGADETLGTETRFLELACGRPNGAVMRLMVDGDP